MIARVSFVVLLGAAVALGAVSVRMVRAEPARTFVLYGWIVVLCAIVRWGP